MSFNRWNYVEGNPINYTDPSGHEPCTEDGPRYCYLSTGGFLDYKHFKTGKRLATQLLTQVEIEAGRQFGQISLNSALLTSAFQYRVTYHTNIPKEGIPEKLEGIAFGMFVDFEMGKESAQLIDPRCFSALLFYISHCSAYSNEDFPSNYLGFVSASRNLSYEYIVGQLDQNGGDARDYPPIEYWGQLGDPHICDFGKCNDSTPFNNCFSLKVLDEVTRKYVLRPWPSSLIVDPPIGFGTYWARNISDLRPGTPSP